MPIIKDNSVKQDFTKNEIPKSETSLNSTPKEKGLVSIVGSLLPLAPVLFEQWTGQKIPPMTGTLAEMNIALSQLAQSLNQVLQNQQQLWTKLEQLEQKSQTSLSHLNTQMQTIQSIRLAHTKERKEIEYGGSKEEEY